MELLFTICAVAGGTILVIQVLLLFLGLDHGADTDVHVGDVPHGDFAPHVASDAPIDSGEGASADAATHSFTVISVKTLNAFMTFFGLAGLLGLHRGFSTGISLAFAAGGGILAFYLVGYCWTLLYRLQSAGNIDMRNAVGVTGRVYLKVPPRDGGRGKVTVAVQGRTLELNAINVEDRELTTGTPVRVVGLVGSDTVRVSPVQES